MSPQCEPALPPPGSLQEEETLRQLVERLQEGIYITNAEGDLLDANPAMLELLGLSSLEELRHHKVTDFIHPELRSWKRQRIEQEGFIRDFELRLTRPDGSVRTVLDSAYRRTDPLTGQATYCGILVDITERKRLEEQLREQAIRDPLTGCFNRRYLSLFESTSNGLPGSWGCIVLDVDHFKRYNDERGHAAGDEALIQLSRFLLRQVRAEEAVIRMGGDEFLVLLGQAGAVHTEALVRRIEASAHAEFVPPFSLGWAARVQNENLEQTINRADANLYAIRTALRGPQRERRAS